MQFETGPLEWFGMTGFCSTGEPSEAQKDVSDGVSKQLKYDLEVTVAYEIVPEGVTAVWTFSNLTRERSEGNPFVPPSNARVFNQPSGCKPANE